MGKRRIPNKKQFERRPLRFIEPGRVFGRGLDDGNEPLASSLPSDLILHPFTATSHRTIGIFFFSVSVTNHRYSILVLFFFYV